MGKMPPIPSGPKASPVPGPTEHPSQKAAVAAQGKLKKKEAEVKTEAEEPIPEKVKETASSEKTSKVTSDPKQEESKVEKDKVSTLPDKKPLPKEEKLLSEERTLTTKEKTPPLEEKKVPLEEKGPMPEDMRLSSEAKTSALEEEDKCAAVEPVVQIAEEKSRDRGAPERVPEEQQSQPQMGGPPPGPVQTLPSEEDRTAERMGQPQAAGPAKPEQVEPGREKTDKEEDKSDTSSSQQPKSPQGLSDTGYSSDGISGSLGEIPSLIPSDEKDLLKELKKDTFSRESSPSSPSDLAKLESTVLSILEAQATTLVDEGPDKKAQPPEACPEQPRGPQGAQGLSRTVGRSAAEGGLGQRQEEKDASEKGRQGPPGDSSEGETSPVPPRKRGASVGSSSSEEDKQDSAGSGDGEEEEEDFIRKQILERGGEQPAGPPGGARAGSAQKGLGFPDELPGLELLRPMAPREDIVCSSYIIPESPEIVDLDSPVTSAGEEKQLLDADAAYEALLRRQHMQLRPSPAPAELEAAVDADRVPDASLTSSVLSAASLTDSTSSATLSIPDVRITQHFSTEETEDEYVTDYSGELREVTAQESPILASWEPSESAASAPPWDTASLTSSLSSICTTGSSSPVGTLHGLGTVGTGPADTVAQSEGSAQTSSSTYLPGSVIDYPEEISRPSRGQSGAPASSSGAELMAIPEPEAAEAAPRVPAALGTDAEGPSAHSPVSEKAAKEPGDGAILDVLDAYEDKSKEPETEPRETILGEAACAQPASPAWAPPGMAPVAEPPASAYFRPSEGVGQESPPSHLAPGSGSPSASSLPAQSRPFSRSTSLDISAPPPPPPASPKPAVLPKRKPTAAAPLTPATTVEPLVDAVTTAGAEAALRSSESPGTKMCTAAPPPVPPKPSSIRTALIFTHRPEPSKPPIAPKPAGPQLPGVAQKPAGLSLGPSMTLDLEPPTEYRPPSPTPPLSPHSSKSSPRVPKSLMETYVVITLPSEPGTPTDSPSQAMTSWALGSPPKELVSTEPVFSVIPPVSSAEIPDSSQPTLYLEGTVGTFSAATTVAMLSPFQGAPVSDPQFLPVQVYKAEAPAARSTFASTGPGSVSISIPPEPLALDNLHLEKRQYKENGKLQLVGDAIDLRTVPKADVKATEKCVDLSASAVDVKRQMMANDTYGRQVSVVQPSVINLSPVSSGAAPVSLDTKAANVVTCTTTASYTTATESLVGVEHAIPAPLQLTTSKHAEPPYRVPSTQAFPPPREEAPINLSLGPSAHAAPLPITKPVTAPPVGVTNGWTDSTTSQAILEGEVVDLSTTKSHRTVVTIGDSTSGVVTKIIEDDEKPVDLTAGRRAVCCDVVSKLPFGRSCTAQQPAATLPEDRFGYRDDHYQYGRSGPYGYRGVGGMKPSMSDTNLAEAGHFFYKSKNAFDYSGGADAAVDLTSGRISTGEVMDYSSKTTGAYPETRQVISGAGISTPQYSTARMTPPPGPQYGVGSVLRSSNGVVYSSVATPVPSTFAITTQPGSIFSTTIRDLSGIHTADSVTSLSVLHQSQPLPRSYFITTGSSETDVAVTGVDISASLQTITMEALTAEAIDSVPTLTTVAEVFSQVVGDESTLLIVPEEDKQQQQLDLERELLELEKIKQQRFAEELEWERQEIQRFREQEKIMKIRQIYQYNYDPSGAASPQAPAEQAVLEGPYAAPEGARFWAPEDATTTASGGVALEIPQAQGWYAVQSDGVTQYIAPPGILSTVSEIPLTDVVVKEEKQPRKRSSGAKARGQYDELGRGAAEDPRGARKIVDSGVQTDDEDAAERSYASRRRRPRKGVDTSVQTDDEDQDEWDAPGRSRRKARVGKGADGGAEADKARAPSKATSVAVQTVAEISVQTEPVGTIRTPSVRAREDAKVEIVKHISAPEKTFRGGSLGCQTEADSDTQSPQYLSASSPRDKKRPTPLEIGYSCHLRADSALQPAPSPPKSPKVLYSPISPLSSAKALESAFVPYEKPLPDEISPQKVLHPDMAKAPPASPKTAKTMQRSLSDPKPLSPTAEESSRAPFQYTEGFTTKGSQTTTASGSQKKVKRTLPPPPPEEAPAGTPVGLGPVGSASRRRTCRTNSMARAKILQDIDRELDLVERESAKLRKKQAELDEEEKEIDAKLRYLEMGINRRKEALLKEREERERAYLQGVAEDRDYVSDSEVSGASPARVERPRTAPQPEFGQFLPPQTQAQAQVQSQFPYSAPARPTQAPTAYTQQPALFHPQGPPFQAQAALQAVATLSFPPYPAARPAPAQPAPTPQPSYPLPSQVMLIQQKARQPALYLEPKITSNYEVVRNQALVIAPVSTDATYAVSHLGGKYSSLDLRMGLEERSSMASSPISSISADSFYADMDSHTSRNYVLIDDMGQIAKGTAPLSSAFSLHEKDLSKADRLLRTTETRRSQEMTEFLAPLQPSSRLHSYVKAEEEAMEDPYELKLLKHQIKQEFRRGAESLDHLAGLSHYYHADTSYRHFPKSEKYSISRLTLEKQAAKQLPAAILYQKQSKHKKSLIDPKMSKFSPIQESRDLEPDYSSYMTSSTSSIGGISSRARLLQDDITFGLKKNITDQQKFLGSSLGSGLGTLGSTIRSALQDEADKPYGSGSRSRPSSRPSSVYGLDLSIKRDSSSSSLRLKAQEAEVLDVSFGHASASGRTKPTSLPISQSRGRIPIVAQNSEEESPLSPHMREESRTRGYDRDITSIIDDFQHAMSDSEAYHLRREETDWFDKPRESRLENGHLDRKLPERLVHSRPLSQHQEQILQMNGKTVHYIFPHARIKITRNSKDHTVSGLWAPVVLAQEPSPPTRARGLALGCGLRPALAWSVPLCCASVRSRWRGRGRPVCFQVVLGLGPLRFLLGYRPAGSTGDPSSLARPFMSPASLRLGLNVGQMSRVHTRVTLL
ncbi:Protein piccolo [Heterocephalus glaber]|uniref:Protein piccolo n=1 Tax=Heterocephalus glaber TaxID=10181 RepID=G5B0R4_HETGA|nr:Protein piccolo [Heterocephalus glaber]